VDLTIINTDCAYRTILHHNKTNRIGIGIINKTQHKDYQDVIVKAYSLIYVINGTGEYQDQNGQKYQLKPGSIFQRIPGQIHSNWVTPNENWLECFIDLGEDFYSALESYNFITMKSPVGYIGLDETLIQRFLKLKDSFSRALDHDLQFHFLEILNLFTFIMKKFGQKSISNQNQQIIEKSCLWLSNNKNYNLPIQMLCRNNSWGYEKFRKLFQKEMGLSPGKYRIMRRMERACQLLQKENKPIKEIALLLGYPNAFDFSNQFKKTYNVTPSKFKRS